MSIHSKGGHPLATLPGKTLLDEIHLRLVLSLAADPSNIVAQASVSTYQHSHCSDLVLDLHVDQGVNIRATREHLNGSAGTLDFLGVARARDEQHDPEDLTTAVHRQNASHPGPDPLEMFGGLDDPDQGNATGRHGPFGKALDEMPHKWYLMCDADTACKEHDRAIRVHGMNATIRAFCERSQGYPSTGGALSTLEQFIGKASAATDQQGNGCLLEARKVLLGHRDTLFACGEFLGFAPPDGEGVAHPETNGWDIQVDVLAGLEGPGPCHLQGDSQGIARQGLDLRCRGLPSAVTVHDDEDASGSLGLLLIICLIFK